jgi:hypothetical protein
METMQLLKIMGQSHSVKADISSAKQEIQNLFLEPRCLFTYSKEPATSPYPKPMNTVYILSYPFFKIQSIFAWVFQVVPFLLILLPEPCMHFCDPCVPRVPHPRHHCILYVMTTLLIFGDK